MVLHVASWPSAFWKEWRTWVSRHKMPFVQCFSAIWHFIPSHATSFARLVSLICDILTRPIWCGLFCHASLTRPISSFKPGIGNLYTARQGISFGPRSHRSIRLCWNPLRNFRKFLATHPNPALKLLWNSVKPFLFWSSPLSRPRIASNLGLTSLQNLWRPAETFLGLVMARVGEKVADPWSKL